MYIREFSSKQISRFNSNTNTNYSNFITDGNKNIHKCIVHNDSVVTYTQNLSSDKKVLYIGYKNFFGNVLVSKVNGKYIYNDSIYKTLKELKEVLSNEIKNFRN